MITGDVTFHPTFLRPRRGASKPHEKQGPLTHIKHTVLQNCRQTANKGTHWDREHMVTEDTWRQRNHAETEDTRGQGSHRDRGHIETAYARRQDAHIAERRDTEREERQTDIGDTRRTQATRRFPRLFRKNTKHKKSSQDCYGPLRQPLNFQQLSS